jgi:addiction module HigA family antidote
MMNMLHESFAVHPGCWLRTEVVEPLGLTSVQLAGQLARQRGFVDAVLAGNVPVSADLADQLEVIFSVQASTLLTMQKRFDERRSA